MVKKPQVRVAVVSFRCTDSLVALLTQLRSQSDDWQIYVWDNHSEASEFIQELLISNDLADWTYFCPENRGFAHAINQIAALPGLWDVFLTVNPDLQIVGSLDPVITACEQRSVAAASGCASTSGRLDCTNAYEDVGPFGLAIRSLKGRAHEHIQTEPFGDHTRLLNGWVEGSLLAFSRLAWTDVGPLDERFFLYSEEQDWQRRARLKDWDIAQVSTPLFVHAAKGSVSDNEALQHLSDNMQEESRRRYIQKWWGNRGLILYRCVLSLGSLAKRCFTRKFWRGA